MKNKLIIDWNSEKVFNRARLLASLKGDNSKSVIDSLQLPNSIEPHKIDLNSGHPFKKFISKPNWKK